MRPGFRILADGKDVTRTIRDRLMELRVTDLAGLESDTVEIKLDDRPSHIEVPRRGAKLEVSIGYEETGIARMGFYVVDEVGLSGPPETMLIRARAADLRQGLKSPKTRSWDNLTLGALVATIAGEHGYTPRVAEDLAGISIPHLDQTEESDLHLLTRLAKDVGAISKPAADMLLFVPEGETKSFSGKDLPLVPLSKPDLNRWNVTIADRGKYQSVKARWRDIQLAQDVEVTAGSGEPVYVIRRSYPDYTSALNAAKAKLSAFERGASTINMTTPGDVRLAAEGKIRVSGVREGVNGEWVLVQVTHTYNDRSGYTVDVEGETPK